MTQTRVSFARHSAAHEGSSLRLRSLHSHLPPHDLSRSRNDLLFSEFLQKRSLHVHLNLSLSSDMAVTVAGTPLGALLVGRLVSAEPGLNIGADGDKVDSTAGAVAGEAGMNVEAVGDKVDGCAGRWSLAAGTKVVAVGDSVESMDAAVAADAAGGVDCVGCACDDSVVVVGEQEVAVAPPSV